MNMTRLTTTLVMTAWLAGCSTMSEWFAADTTAPPSPLPSLAADTAGLQVLWTASGGVGAHKQFLRLHPLVGDGQVIVSNADGEIAAYRTTNGESLWRTATNITLSGGTGGGDGLIVVGGTKGEVVALDRKDGKEHWRAELSSEVLAPPGVVDEVVVVRTLDGRVTGLSAINGSRLWVFSRTVPVLTLRGVSTPLIANDRVFVGLDSGQLVTLSLHDGRVLWEATVAVPKGRTELERMVDIDADPILFDGTLYVAAFQGRVVAVDPESGQLHWARTISTATGIAADRDHIYVTDDESVVWCLDRTTGSALWRQETLRNRDLTGPTAYGDLVLVGDLEGYLHALNREDGRIVGRFSLESKPVLTAPIVHGDVLYATGSGGAIAALKKPSTRAAK